VRSQTPSSGADRINISTHTAHRATATAGETFFPVRTNGFQSFSGPKKEKKRKEKEKGYLVRDHYYLLKLEKRHYYSRILKFAITILDFPRICHGIRMKSTQVQLQVYTKTYISLYLGSPLNDTRDPLVSIISLLSSPFLLFSCVHRSEQGSGSGGRRGGAATGRVPRRGLPRSAESDKGRRRGIPKREGASQLPGVRR
jgi:hypothetical protein